MKRAPGLTYFHDKKFNFKEIFNAETGFYLRTGVLKKEMHGPKDIDTGVDPFMRSAPSLVDIGVMGRCVHGADGLCIRSGVQCYQDGLHVKEKNMSLEDFKTIVRQIKGRAFQCALGGRGDPNKHDHFEEILSYCRQNHIVPNYTTSGLDITDKEIEFTRKYCGAAAISFYGYKHTFEALDKFIKGGVRTNIHYVLSNNSIDQAIDMLENNGFPENINAVIFLLHKPVGLGSQSNVLEPGDGRTQRFFKLTTSKKYAFKTGFDSCCVPGLLNYADKVDPRTIEPCEGARFSCYITPDMKMTPCSFDQAMNYSVDLREYTIEDAWNSERFEAFRSFLNYSCPSCDQRNECMGGCPLTPEISLCLKEDRVQRRKEMKNENAI